MSKQTASNSINGMKYHGSSGRAASHRKPRKPASATSRVVPANNRISAFETASESFGILFKPTATANPTVKTANSTQMQTNGLAEKSSASTNPDASPTTNCRRAAPLTFHPRRPNGRNRAAVTLRPKSCGADLRGCQPVFSAGAHRHRAQTDCANQDGVVEKGPDTQHGCHGQPACLWPTQPFQMGASRCKRQRDHQGSQTVTAKTVAENDYVAVERKQCQPDQGRCAVGGKGRSISRRQLPVQ